MGLVMPPITYLLAQNLPTGSTMRHRLRRAWPVFFVLLTAMLFGAMPTAVQGQSTVDYDTDDNGLIEGANLARLNATRWDLDGDGSSGNAGYAAAFANPADAMGCPESRCWGYELTANLDFDTDGSGAIDAGDDYWNDGAGWDTIGTFTCGDASTSYGASFNGNQYTISNLLISRSAEQ